MAIIDEKYQELVENLKSLGSILVGFSGGVDSTFLLYAALDALGKEKVLAVTAVSPSLADRERNEARTIAIKLNANHLEITTDEMGIPEYRANTELRCMHCKNELYTKLREKAGELGYDHVVDATNADEAGGHRPGLKAIDKLDIKTPLKEAGLSKREIRQLSNKFDLPTWDKPSMACLASRIPYGSEVNEEKLKRIGSAEEYLLNLGVRQVR
ncbi:MAG: ATP-dependent sacrificial sulfur transferase LarE, partial [candidate division Zixibacteria bacterium]|nr:ATP-dependent sacrificial sulfur transferase LarE [candidate division Zixibacteria bacterium]